MTVPIVNLPTAGGGVDPYRLGSVPAHAVRAGTPSTSRLAYSAAHVVADPLADVDPTGQVAIDWDATMAFRRHLWSLGLGVADAMDTAQRSHLDWPTVQELLRRSIDAAEGRPLVCGIATDQLDGDVTSDVDAVIGAYEEQLAFVEDLGGRAVIMASPALARAARGPDDYHRVYDHLLGAATRPAVIHWLGPMFDPRLAGYWGSDDAGEAADVVIDIVSDHATMVEGVKVSLLDAAFEVAFRRRLPNGVRCMTGDDFNYAELIAGDDHGHSDALLGIFDPIAPVAAAALRALDDGDLATWDSLLAPTVPLSRHLFSAPTYHYKTGVVFLAWLTGHQDHFRMVAGSESARSAMHLGQVVRLADHAGLLADPELAARRTRDLMRLAGVADHG